MKDFLFYLPLLSEKPKNYYLFLTVKLRPSTRRIKKRGLRFKVSNRRRIEIANFEIRAIDAPHGILGHGLRISNNRLKSEGGGWSFEESGGGASLL